MQLGDNDAAQIRGILNSNFLTLARNSQLRRHDFSQNGNFLYICTVRVIAKKTLRTFWTKHRDAEERLKAWYKEAEESKWKGPVDIKRDYPTASFLQDNRVVFNIKGNHYRLIVKINYDYGIVWIRFVGTHIQYDKINALTIRKWKLK